MTFLLISFFKEHCRIFPSFVLSIRTDFFGSDGVVVVKSSVVVATVVVVSAKIFVKISSVLTHNSKSLICSSHCYLCCLYLMFRKVAPIVQLEVQ